MCSKKINQNCVESVGKYYHETCMKVRACIVLLRHSSRNSFSVMSVTFF